MIEDTVRISHEGVTYEISRARATSRPVLCLASGALVRIVWTQTDPVAVEAVIDVSTDVADLQAPWVRVEREDIVTP